MIRALIITLGSLIVVGLASFIYIFQKKDEETQQLKEIMVSVRGKVIEFKNSPLYPNVPDEAKAILDYVATATALTTILGPSYNPLKDIQNIMHEKK